MDKIPNADLLFLYDVKMANPNGDPDDENKPRMDEVTRRALVSDVRLKRYLRDYWIHKGEEVWVQEVNGETVTADIRLKGLMDRYRKEKGKEVDRKKLSREFNDWLLDSLLDVRLFGAVMPIAKEGGEARGDNITFTGPVQFSWGYSLHRAEIVLSPTITSTFAGRGGEEKGKHGTMGKDWRLHYALIAFFGHISRARAEWTRLQEKDLEKLEDALIHAIEEEATTRSKLGQTPRVYLRVDYKDHYPMLGDFRDHIKLKHDVPDERLRSVEDYTVNLSDSLTQSLKKIKENIAQVRFWVHPDLKLGSGWNELENLPGFKRL